MNHHHTLIDIVVRQELPSDNANIEALGAVTFGPGRFSRSAFRLREGVKPDLELSFVAELNGELAGSVRLTPIWIGERQALVLGPLMVAPSCKNLGIGRELMNRSLRVASLAGHALVVLVGDYSYYKAFGFRHVPHGQIIFPGPADPNRILACELNPEVLPEYRGETRRAF